MCDASVINFLKAIDLFVLFSTKNFLFPNISVNRIFKLVRLLFLSLKTFFKDLLFESDCVAHLDLLVYPKTFLRTPASEPIN